ncbi:unnamed protein product [Brassicogethes aeneus]|uniref:CCHC-type domain-containing protein n=1 Tax=Brassicogethes aeneus TaxID=1431903 RepID=A0A9P0B4M7_BRAAE|nr:unnamed protein product [Brassicogethes aeneus]
MALNFLRSSEFADLIRDIIKKENEKLYEKISQLENEIKTLKECNGNVVPQRINASSSKIINNTYAKAAGDCVIIKPKGAQNCDVTREEVRKNVLPAELKIGIQSIKDIKNGGVAIHCNKKSDANKIKSAAEECLKDYEIKLPKLHNPTIKIIDIEDKFEDTELIEYLRKQNKILENSNLKIVVNKKMKTKYMAIIECDNESYKKIMEDKVLYVNWASCRVFEYVKVFRCFKCGGFNHHGEKCTAEKRYLKCTSVDHETKDCDNNSMLHYHQAVVQLSPVAEKMKPLNSKKRLCKKNLDHHKKENIRMENVLLLQK